MSENTPESRPLFETGPRQPLRIVFQHACGPLAGLRAIMGLPAALGLGENETLPAAAEDFEAQGRVISFAGLVKVERGYALYREPMPFGKHQKDFHPEQQ